MRKAIELDEAEYNNLVALRGIAQKIVANPEARKRLEEAHKMVDPNVPTPALDAEKNNLAPVNALKSELSAEIDKIRKEREDEKREQTLARIAADQEAAFKRLKNQAHYTDEGVEQIRKLMENKGLIDVDDAVAIFERTHPPQMPSTPSGGMTGERWNFADATAESDKDIQALLSSKGEGATADAAAMRMANAALNEIRGARR